MHQVEFSSEPAIRAGPCLHRSIIAASETEAIASETTQCCLNYESAKFVFCSLAAQPAGREGYQTNPSPIIAISGVAFFNLREVPSRSG
jgi:hypothetical protein